MWTFYIHRNIVYDSVESGNLLKTNQENTECIMAVENVEVTEVDGFA